MSGPSGRIAPFAMAVALVSCSAEDRASAPDISAATSSTTSLPACEIDPYYCYAEPFALGAWIGDTGPFAALVLSDQICGDYGYCFVGRLTNGTHITGWYFDRPQLVRFTWSGGAEAFEGYELGAGLTFYRGPEGNVIPVATLHSVPSWCDQAQDCALQTLKPMPCRETVTMCRHERCKQNCGAASGK